MGEHGSGTNGSGLTSAQLLRRYRLLAGHTQEELGARSGYSGDYIRKLERGRRQAPQAALNRIAEALGLGHAERNDLLAAREGSRDAEPRARPLAGRARELVEIRRLLAGVGSPALLFTGEPGIGKTRLLEEAALLAAQGGWRVIRGGSQRRAQDPYGPLTDALAESLRQLSPAQCDDALRRAGRLGLLLPEHRTTPDGSISDATRETAAGPPLRAAQERRLLFAAVADYMEAVAGEQGVLLVLDDLQWAGPDALDLLTLVLNSRTTPIRLIGVYRDSETPSGAPLAAFVADLARASLVQVRDLDPLSEDEARQLLTQLIPDNDETRRALVPAILRRAGGVPLFLVSYVEDVREGHAVETDMELPWTVAQIIRQRVVALPEPVREVLGVAAVLGREVPPALLAGVTGHSEEELLEALEAAADARLLQQDADGGYRFRHDLIREAIEQDLSVGRRQLVHRRIGEALERLPERRREGRVSEIAWRFVQGGDPERAVPWALRAGDRAAALFAYGDAERQYQTAAELAGETGDTVAEVDALDRLGDVRYRLGRFGDALEPLERAAAIYARLGDRDRHLGIVARAGEAYGFAGRAAEGLDRVVAVIRAEESGPQHPPSAAMADVYASLCSLYLHCLRGQDALKMAGRAIAVAEETGNLRALCAAEISRGIALALANRVEEQRHAFERAASVAEPLGDPWLLALAVYHHGVSYVLADDVEQGRRHLRRALDVADRAGLIAWSSFGRARFSGVLVAHGRWAEARSEAERAAADSRSLGPRPGGTYPLIELGRILLLQGQREDGLRCLREALEMATRYAYLPGLTQAQEGLAWQEVRDGRPMEAIARLEPLLERARAAGLPWYPTVYVTAQLEVGNEQRAAEALRGLRQQVTASTSRAGLPDLLLQSARVASRQDRWEDAVRDLEEGLAIARELGLPYDEARLLEEYSRLQAAIGEPEQARRHLEEALALFRQLGASPDVERVAQNLDAVTLPAN
jgi:tetratricopeptide (TPR) repeat protein/transcriptional regulator with XRE-family HTH domain